MILSRTFGPRATTAAALVALLAAKQARAAVMRRDAVPGAPGLVAVDPGHGDPGPYGPKPGAVAGDGTTEAELNLAAALTLKHYLTQRGIPVHLTRSSSAGPSYGDRVAAAHASGAQLFVAIHHDSPAATRAGVYHNPHPRAVRLARQLAAAMGGDSWVEPDTASRFGRLYIRDFDGPAVLLELGPTSSYGRQERIARVSRVLAPIEATVGGGGQTA